MTIPVEYRLSGGAANSDPNASLGGDESSVEVDSAQNNNLFDAVPKADTVNGLVTYRCIYVHAPAGGDDYTDVGIYLQTPSLSSDSRLFLAVAPEGKNAAAQGIADEFTEPDDVIFTAPTQDYSALDLPDLSAGDYIGVWVKRVVDAGAGGYPNDYARLNVKGTVV